MRMMIAMQYYPGDQATAMEVARLMADVELNRRPDVDFLFAARHDAEFDPDTEAYCRRKFANVYRMQGRRKDSGWPAGPNALWFETMQWALLEKRDNRRDFDFIFTLESDTVPLTRDWLDQCLKAWTDSRVQVLGHLVHGHLDPHINGNAMFAPELVTEIPELYSTPPDESWDTFHSKKLVARSKDCPLIVSRHGMKTIDADTLYEGRKDGVGPVFHHGVKDASARTIVRSKLKL